MFEVWRVVLFCHSELVIKCSILCYLRILFINVLNVSLNLMVVVMINASFESREKTFDGYCFKVFVLFYISGATITTMEG